MIWTVEYTAAGGAPDYSPAFTHPQRAEAWKRTLLRTWKAVKRAEVVAHGEAVPETQTPARPALVECALIVDGEQRWLRLNGRLYELHGDGGAWLLTREDGECYRIQGGRCDCKDAVCRKRTCKHVLALRDAQLI